VEGRLTTGGKKAEALRPAFWRGLSGKVLVLTVLFVMMGEVLIFLPSIANFRIVWLKERVATAEIAALAAEAAPGGRISDQLRKELLKGAKVRAVSLKRNRVNELILRDDSDPRIERVYDIRERQWLAWIVDAFMVLAHRADRSIGVIDIPPNMSGETIEIALDEVPLRTAMFTYARNILILSIILSLIVAALIFVALNWVLVRPMQRITMSMLDFSSNPENPKHVITPSERSDEIGIAERELHHMQHELSTVLQNKSRLAALGLAVSKVSHDLRGMLSSTQLLSDRLAMIDDPTVKKLAPKLIASLDRAITFCAQTLKFGRAQEAPPRRERFKLHTLIEEIVETAAAQASSRIVLYNETPVDLLVDADRDHLYRVVMNLARNAVEALEARFETGGGSDGAVWFRGRRDGHSVTLEIKDNGPGVPQKARDHLFEPFQGTARPGGTGLGLAIASELVKAHGGEIKLVRSSSEGSEFWVIFPDRVAEAKSGRRGQRLDPSAA
jgi:signal transduction histidine kinase